MEKDPFKEYLKESEPDKAYKSYAWSTAIGLQAVDGLKPSKYLIDTAIQNIEGKITIKEAKHLIDSYYEEKTVQLSDDERTEEADKVALRIAEILSETAFSFSPNEYISIHRKLFQGIYSHAGKIRDYNITKKEWVLDGASVVYGSASELRATLEYDFGPLALSWNTYFAGDDYTKENGDRAYSTYVGISAPFKLGGLDWSAEVGLTPWEGVYANKFNVTNLTLKAEKEIKFTNSFSLPTFAQVTFNPHTQGAYFVFGVSF